MSKNVDVVSALYEAFGRRDVPAIVALIGPEFALTQTELLPWGGHYTGVEGLRAFFERLFENVESRVQFDEYVEAGDVVVAIGRTRGHVRANGTAFDIRAVHVWTVRDGRAVRFQPYINTPEMLRALQGP